MVSLDFEFMGIRKYARLSKICGNVDGEKERKGEREPVLYPS